MYSNTSDQSIDLAFDFINNLDELILFIILISIVIELVVFFAIMKLYTIDSKLKEQQKMLDSIDTHTYELSSLTQSQIRVLYEINTNLIEIKKAMEEQKESK